VSRAAHSSGSSSPLTRARNPLRAAREAQRLHRRSPEPGARDHAEVLDRTAHQSRERRRRSGERQRLQQTQPLAAPSGELEDQPLARRDHERAHAAFEGRERAVLDDARGRDAPFELGAAAARDLERRPAAVAPALRHVVGRCELARAGHELEP
jgi:hypothetical protein